MKKEIKPKDSEPTSKKVKKLKKENEYLKAKIEYSKKLRAVVQARKNQPRRKSRCSM